MTIEDRVRRIYELRPYPPVSLREKRERRVLPPIEWLDAMREQPPEPYRRILVAGCGVGSEAFAIARRFPEALVTGVDFSPRSIATAKRLRRKAPGGERIRFEIADIAADNLVAVTGGKFDLVSCHGVLSYIPDRDSALKNLARCLTARGALMLGVNGASHPSARFRAALRSFQIDPEEFRESRRTRSVLGLLDSISSYPPVSLADQNAAYLAGDLFGPLNESLPVAEWSRTAHRSRLHVRASYDAQFAIRVIINRDVHAVLMPRTRGETAELIDLIQPASFHRLLLTKTSPLRPPWCSRSLLKWRPVLTKLFSIRMPQPRGSWRGMREVVMESRPTATKVTMQVPRWQAEIFREARGDAPLRDILQRVRPVVTPREVSERLFGLYLLGAVNLLPA